jgi:hypothetical protein
MSFTNCWVLVRHCTAGSKTASEPYASQHPMHSPWRLYVLIVHCQREKAVRNESFHRPNNRPTNQQPRVATDQWTCGFDSSNPPHQGGVVPLRLQLSTISLKYPA